MEQQLSHEVEYRDCNHLIVDLTLRTRCCKDGGRSRAGSTQVHNVWTLKHAMASHHLRMGNSDWIQPSPDGDMVGLLVEHLP
jgi:hypothetical protein